MLNINTGNIYSIIIRYSSSTDVNVSLFNPMLHLVTDHRLGESIVALPTSTTIEIFKIHPMRITQTFEVTDPSVVEENISEYLRYGLSDNVTFEYIPLIKMSDDHTTAFVHSSCFHHVNIEEFLMDHIEKHQRLTDYR